MFRNARVLFDKTKNCWITKQDKYNKEVLVKTCTKQLSCTDKKDAVKALLEARGIYGDNVPISVITK